MGMGLFAAGCASAPDPDIRDLRPLQIQRGDKVIVEASRPMFSMDAPTRVVLDKVVVGGAPLAITGRAVSPTRILFDADADLVGRIAGHVLVNTTVTVEQT